MGKEIAVLNLNTLQNILYCRSCIIGPLLEIKICSFGSVINRTAYPADYCYLGSGRQSQPLPIRWMAWESVVLVRFAIIILKIYDISLRSITFLGKVYFEIRCLVVCNNAMGDFDIGQGTTIRTYD